MKTIFDFEPVRRISVCARPSTVVVAWGLPMLNTWPTAESMCIAEMKASRKSSTKHQERIWEPSLNTVMSVFRSARPTICCTAPSPTCLGPYTLNGRTVVTLSPKSEPYACAKCSPASLLIA